LKRVFKGFGGKNLKRFLYNSFVLPIMTGKIDFAASVPSWFSRHLTLLPPEDLEVKLLIEEGVHLTSPLRYSEQYVEKTSPRVNEIMSELHKKLEAYQGGHKLYFETRLRLIESNHKLSLGYGTYP
jgi:hypothetical protein